MDATTFLMTVDLALSNRLDHLYGIDKALKELPYTADREHDIDFLAKMIAECADAKATAADFMSGHGQLTMPTE